MLAATACCRRRTRSTSASRESRARRTLHTSSGLSCSSRSRRRSGRWRHQGPGRHTLVGPTGATWGVQAVPPAGAAAVRAAVDTAVRAAVRVVDTPRVLRRTRSTCVRARIEGVRRGRGEDRARERAGGVRSSYAGELPTLCSTRSHCRPNSRTTEGSPHTHRCSPSIQCRAPGCLSPRTVQGEAETEGAARADPGSQAYAAAVGLAAAVAVEVQRVAVTVEVPMMMTAARWAVAPMAAAAGSRSAQSTECPQGPERLQGRRSPDRWACRDTRSGRLDVWIFHHCVEI